MSLKKIKLALTLSLGLIFLNCENSSSKNAKLLEPIEYKTFLIENDVLLVDLRTPKEFNSGHIENAINVNFLSLEFDKDIQKLDTTKTILIYCRSGNRSRKSVAKLVEAGFDEIYDLKGGVLNWKKKGQELVK